MPRRNEREAIQGGEAVRVPRGGGIEIEGSDFPRRRAGRSASRNEAARDGRADRGSQYVSIRFTERLAKAGVATFGETSGTATTMRWPRRSTAWSRDRGYPSVPPVALLRGGGFRDHGERGLVHRNPASSRAHWQTCRLPRRKRATMPRPRSKPSATPDPNQSASGKPGAVRRPLSLTSPGASCEGLTLSASAHTKAPASREVLRR